MVDDERRVDEKRAVVVGRLVRIPALVAAAEKFYAVVASHAVGAPDVIVPTAGLLIDIVAQGAERRREAAG